MTATQLLNPWQAPREDVAHDFDRVVIGIDLGTASLAAARWAMTNVTPDANAILVHVVPHATTRTEKLTTEFTGDDHPGRLVPTLTGGLGGFAATLGASSTRSLVRIGRPSDWLSSITNGVEASLVVLGRRADSRRRRKGEPNVLERVTRRSSTSVLVVPEGTTGSPGHILAAVDESAFARPILRIARSLARLHRCRLTVLHVVSPTEGVYDRFLRDPRSGAAAAIGDGRIQDVTPLHGSDFGDEPVRVELLMGDPTREILGAASRLEAPLVVVGQRGADHAPPGSLGSVVRELLTRAPTPILVASDRGVGG